MRTARIADYWRAVYAERYPIRLDRTEFNNVIGIGTGGIEFAGGITAICGNNGVGKSTLLNTVFSSVCHPTANDMGGPRFVDATLATTLTTNADSVNVGTTFNPSARTVIPETAIVVNIIRIDPAQVSQQLIHFFSKTPSISELLEPYSPKDLDVEELATLNYVVGKQYSRCKVTEIADYEDLGTFPYFEVVNDGIAYGSEMMGLGELALHVMLWHLGRIESRSVLLIEEPETHISPRSQQALLNVLARTSARKKVWIIVTTHSAGIVARIPREHIRLVYRDGAVMRTISSPTENQLNAVIGVTNAIRAILLVEDRIARLFGREWIARAAPQLAHQVDVRDCGSLAKINSVMSAFPHGPVSPRLVALYDGDQRNSCYDWPHAYLPGTSAPEIVLRSEVGDGQRLAAILSKDSEGVRFALDHFQGLDHHDWIIELARHLAVSVDNIIAALTAVWLASDSGARESEAALNYLQNSIDSTG